MKNGTMSVGLNIWAVKIFSVANSFAHGPKKGVLCLSWSRAGFGYRASGASEAVIGTCDEDVDNGSWLT